MNCTCTGVQHALYKCAYSLTPTYLFLSLLRLSFRSHAQMEMVRVRPAHEKRGKYTREKIATVLFRLPKKEENNDESSCHEKWCEDNQKNITNGYHQHPELDGKRSITILTYIQNDHYFIVLSNMLGPQ